MSPSRSLLRFTSFDLAPSIPIATFAILFAVIGVGLLRPFLPTTLSAKFNIPAAASTQRWSTVVLAIAALVHSALLSLQFIHDDFRRHTANSRMNELGEVTLQQAMILHVWSSLSFNLPHWDRLYLRAALCLQASVSFGLVVARVADSTANGINSVCWALVILPLGWYVFNLDLRQRTTDSDDPFNQLECAAGLRQYYVIIVGYTYLTQFLLTLGRVQSNSWTFTMHESTSAVLLLYIGREFQASTEDGRKPTSFDDKTYFPTTV